MNPFNFGLKGYEKMPIPSIDSFACVFLADTPSTQGASED